MSASGSTSWAAASLALANAASVASAPARVASAPDTRIGRSVAALTATRASAMRPPAARHQTATPTEGQSSADSAAYFAYDVNTLAGWAGTWTSTINSSLAMAS